MNLVMSFIEREPVDFSLQEPLLVDEAAHLEQHHPIDGDDNFSSHSRFRRLIEMPPANFLTRFRQRMLIQNQYAELLDDRNSTEIAEHEEWTTIISSPSMTHVFLLVLYLSQIFLMCIALSSPEWIELRIRLPFHADVPIMAFGLAQLLQQTYAAEFGLYTMFLWFLSLVVPSLFTIFAPSLYLNGNSRSTDSAILESFQHVPFAAIYLMNLLAALHSVGSSDASFYVHAKPPIAAFAFGIISSMTYVSVLRIKQGIPKSEESRSNEPEDTGYDEYVPMRILEDLPPNPSRNDSSQARPRVAFWKKFAVLQLGLLSILLWVPTFFFPYIILMVDSGCVRVLEHEIRLGSILLSLPASMMFVPVILGPLASTVASLAAWIVDERFKIACFALRPWIGSINLGLTLWGALHLLPNIMVVPALLLHGRASWGLYTFLMQAVCTELLMIATLSWLP